MKDKRQEMFRKNASRLLGARIQLERFSDNFDIRNLRHEPRQTSRKNTTSSAAGCPKKMQMHLSKEAQGDDKVYIVVEEDPGTVFWRPPTKLENPKLFKPFEMFIKMYGLPKSGEMDPTIFVGIMYSFIFGAMFGDVGQGLLLFIGGAILYFTKKMNLAGIVSLAGIFSTFFGFMFGSVFGFEDIIEAKWIRPINHMTTLPFIGKLNTVFIVSIAFGMGIILIAMIFHIINGIRAKDTETTWFDANGVAGLIFYGAAVTCIVLFMTGHSLPGGIVLAVMFGVPLLLIALKEPLTNKIKRKPKKWNKAKQCLSPRHSLNYLKPCSAIFQIRFPLSVSVHSQSATLPSWRLY